MNLYFTLEFRSCLDLFKRLSVSEHAQAKYVILAFNSKWKYEKLAAVVCVLQNTQNLVISRCRFAEDG